MHAFFHITVVMSLIFSSLISLSNAQENTKLITFNHQPIPSVDAVQGKAYILIEPSHQTILAGKNIHEKLMPASLTKVMTAYVIFNAVKSGRLALEDKTIVSKRARAQEGSRSYLELNDEVSIDTLLRGLLAQSGNDAAVALAEALSGSVEAFIQEMNVEAQRLGMVNTSWENPNGLPMENHLTTAYDLGLLASSIINDFPEFYHYFGIKWFRYNEINQKNRNRLLFDDELDVDGMKTGWTIKAGYCVINSVQQNNMRLISIVLGAPTPQARFDDSQALFLYGLENFQVLPYIQDFSRPLAKVNIFGAKTKSMHLFAQQSPSILVKKDQIPRMHYQITAPDFELGKRTMPTGSQYGRIRFYKNDQLISDQPLYIKQTIEALNRWNLFKETWSRVFK